MTSSAAGIRGLRIAVLYNADFAARDADGADEPPSYAADAEVADTAKHVCITLRRLGADPLPMPVRDSLAGTISRLKRLRIDLVFNLVESLGNDSSREWQVPALLDRWGVAHTGNGPRPLRIAQQKDVTHSLLQRAGVRVARAFVVKGEADCINRNIDGAWFVKPARADGSIGIDQGSVVHTREQLTARVAWLTKHLAGPCLVEQYLPGREINVAIFPDPVQGHLVPTEIDFSGFPDGFAPIVTYDCKWVPGTPEYVARSLPCTSLTAEQHADAIETARRAFLAVGGTSYGRVDLRLDASGAPTVIDVNPNPDLHPEAGLALAAASVGVDYESLVRSLTQDALVLDAATVRTSARS